MSDSNQIPPTPPSPGVGLRRKGPKALPRLPLSAFSGPNTGTGESFPLAPSPSTIHPKSVIDAHVNVPEGPFNLDQWSNKAGHALAGRINGLVLNLSGSEVEKSISSLSANAPTPIISYSVPFRLDDTEQTLPTSLPSSPLSSSLRTVLTATTPESIAGLRKALSLGRPVDIELRASLDEKLAEGFEDLLTKALVDLENPPPIVISNILPPPHNLELTIVKLMNHPTYRAFQSQIAQLSLFPNVYVKFLPPSWNAATPTSPQPGATPEASDIKEKKEWKRRIKMYLGPVMEAFGYQRIIFGSSPAASSTGISDPNNWYELARESLAELGVEQEFVDAVFSGNAREVYS